MPARVHAAERKQVLQSRGGGRRLVYVAAMREIGEMRDRTSSSVPRPAFVSTRARGAGRREPIGSPQRRDRDAAPNDYALIVIRDTRSPSIRKLKWMAPLNPSPPT